MSSSCVDNDDAADPIASLEQLNDLVPRAKITPLVKSKSNWQGALQTVWHFGLLATAAAVAGGNSLRSRLALLVMAFISSFYFCALHECVHQTAFASARLNNVVAQVFGVLCLRPAVHYRYYHWQHHKYTGNPKLDSELQSGSFLDFPVNSIPSYMVYLSGIPFWMDAVGTTLQHATGKCHEIYLTTDKAKRRVTQEARIYVALYIALAVWGVHVPSAGRALMRYWVLPAVAGQPFLRFYLLAEHRGRATTATIYENTRTMNTNWLYCKLAWNMPYHAEHHAWPAVPFYQLPAAHKLLQEATAGSNLLQQGEEILPCLGGQQYGYLRFHWSFLQKMLGRGSKET